MMKKSEKRQYVSIQKRLSILIYVIILIPILVLFFYMQYNTRNRVLENYLAGSQQRLNMLASMVDQRFYLMVDRSGYVLQQNNIVEILSGSEWDDLGNIIAAYERIDNILVSYTLPFNEAKTNVVLYPLNEEIPRGKYIDKLESLKKKPVWERLQDMESQNLSFVWDVQDQSDDKYVSLYRVMKKQDKSPVLFIEIRLEYADIEKLLKNVDVLETETVSYTTRNGVCLFGSEYARAEEYLFCEKMLINGDSVCISIAKKDIYDSVNEDSIILFFVFILVIVAVHFVDKLVISAALKNLNQFVEQIESDKAYLENEQLIEIKGTDEIAIIKQKFKEIIKNTREARAEMDKAEQEKQKLEFEVLQMGINPHLLYNSLAFLRWKMIRSQQKEHVEIIDCVTNYYRRVLSGGKRFVKLRSELEMVSYYVRINRYCYGYAYELNIDVDEELLNCLTLKMLLQPFVENAIVHGFGGEETGVISIKGERFGEDIYLSVTDNGCGMKEEIVKKVIEGEYSSQSSGYAVKNTRNRIKLFYGKDYGMELHSVLGEGTTVKMHIPFILLDEEEQRNHVKDSYMW